jgi:hypothetical protein
VILTERTRQRMGGLVTLFALLFTASSASTCVSERDARRDAEFRAQTLVQVNDSTTARYMRLSAERDSLRALFDAAKTMRGRLVAGVKVRVPAETVVRLDTVPVPTLVNFTDSSRVGILLDTLRTGHSLYIRAVAPPFPDSLRIAYELHTPAFAPEIGIVQRSDGYYAVVSWAGERAETGYAFYRPAATRRVQGVIGNQLTITQDVRHLWSYDAFAGVRLNHRKWESTLSVGQRHRPYIGASLVRTF